jgi:heme oxygenase
MSRSPTLGRLALATTEAALAVETQLFGPLESPSTPVYRRFLSVLYGFQAPLEAELARMTDLAPEFVHERRRAGHIANDLLALGLTRHELPLLTRRQHIEPFTSGPEALGWMYVTERLMLTVETLRVRIESEMPVVFALSSQFLICYRHAIGRRWRELGAQLDRRAVPNADAIVAGAKAGYASLLQWIDSSGPAHHIPAEIARLIA